MKTNVGSYDAAVRFVGGCALLALGNHGWGWWGLIGSIPILSAAAAFCPLYALLHIRTTACDEVAVPTRQKVRCNTHLRVS